MKYFCTLLVMIMNCFCEDNSQVKKNNFLQRMINPEIQKYWNLSGGMCGGKLSPTLEKISSLYYSQETPDKNRARVLYLEIVEYVLHNYNDNSSIQSHLSNYPFMPKNINLAIIFRNNYGVKGSIMAVSGFKDYITYRIEQLDGSINLEHEKFEDAYFSVYGKKWNPFRYGECSNAETQSENIRTYD